MCEDIYVNVYVCISFLQIMNEKQVSSSYQSAHIQFIVWLRYHYLIREAPVVWWADETPDDAND